MPVPAQAAKPATEAKKAESKPAAKASAPKAASAAKTVKATATAAKTGKATAPAKTATGKKDMYNFESAAKELDSFSTEEDKALKGQLDGQELSQLKGATAALMKEIGIDVKNAQPKWMKKPVSKWCK